MRNVTHECQFLKQYIEEPEPKISDVLKCKGGVFNIRGKSIWQSDIRSPSSCSQSVLDAMVIYITASIGISIWEEHFTKVKENCFHYITNFERRNYNVFSLTTQRFTEFSQSEFFETVDSCNEKIVCCPEIKNGLIMYITFAIIQIAAKNYLFLQGRH